MKMLRGKVEQDVHKTADPNPPSPTPKSKGTTTTTTTSQQQQQPSSPPSSKQQTSSNNNQVVGSFLKNLWNIVKDNSSSMFFRLGFQSRSKVEQLLERDSPPATLEEVLDEDEVQQEAKARNSKLIELYVFFKKMTLVPSLSRKDILIKLLEYVSNNVKLVAQDEEAKYYRYAKLIYKITHY